MLKKLNYRDYVADPEMLKQYNFYQERYRGSMRESDKVLIELIRGATEPASLLDIGCSTGNLLRHIRCLVPGLRLSGANLSRSAIEQCRVDPDLAGTAFYASHPVRVVTWQAGMRYRRPSPDAKLASSSGMPHSNSGLSRKFLPKMNLVTAKPYLHTRSSPQEYLLSLPRYFELETVNACNARCTMCTIDDWNRHSPVMKDPLFKKLADEICAHVSEVKRASLYRDGEPLLDKKWLSA